MFITVRSRSRPHTASDHSTQRREKIPLDTMIIPLLLISARGQQDFNRGDLISLRDSIRSITLELHNVASVLDQAVNRNGGPTKPRQHDGRRLSEHMDHSSLESIVRDFPKHEVFGIPGFQSWTLTDSPPKAASSILSHILSWITWAFLLGILFCFDAACALLIQATSRVVAVETPQKPQPGRSRSPIRDEQTSDISTSMLYLLLESIRWDNKAHFSSLGGAICVQIILMLGQNTLCFVIYTFRAIFFLLLCLLLWDNMRSTASIPKFGKT